MQNRPFLSFTQIIAAVGAEKNTPDDRDAPKGFHAHVGSDRVVRRLEHNEDRRHDQQPICRSISRSRRFSCGFRPARASKAMVPRLLCPQSTTVSVSAPPSHLGISATVGCGNANFYKKGMILQVSDCQGMGTTAKKRPLPRACVVGFGYGCILLPRPFGSPAKHYSYVNKNRIFPAERTAFPGLPFFVYLCVIHCCRSKKVVCKTLWIM